MEETCLIIRVLCCQGGRAQPSSLSTFAHSAFFWWVNMTYTTSSQPRSQQSKSPCWNVPGYDASPCGLLFFSFFFGFLEPHLWHMEVPRLRIESELKLMAYTTAVAMWDLSLICHLRHSSRQLQILNPLSKARGQIHILLDTSQAHYCWATKGTSTLVFYPELYGLRFIMRNTQNFWSLALSLKIKLFLKLAMGCLESLLY